MPYAQHIPEHIKNQMYTTGQVRNIAAAQAPSASDSDTCFISYIHRQVQKVEDRRPTRAGHQQNYSLFSIPSPSFSSSNACIDIEGAHHHQQPPGTDRELQARYLHRPTRSTPKAFYASNRDKPLPPLGDTDTDTLRGRDEKMSSIELRDRADMSQGSWLEDEAYMSSHENSVEDGNPFGACPSCRCQAILFRRCRRRRVHRQLNVGAMASIMRGGHLCALGRHRGQSCFRGHISLPLAVGNQGA